MSDASFGAAQERLLRAWEQASVARAGVERAQVLAESLGALAGRALDEAPLAAVEHALTALHRRIFGDRTTLVATCAACRSEVELELDLGRTGGGAVPSRGPHAVEVEGRRVEFLLPTLGDLAAAQAEGDDLARSKRVLLERCLLDTGDAITPAVEASVGEAMSALTADVDIELALTCPRCSQRWDERLDVVELVWRELDVWARRLLVDVHVLARAYGWREPDVLALTPLRRQAYLDQVSG